MAVCILGKYIIPILIKYTGVLSEYSPSETALNFSPHQVNYGAFMVSYGKKKNVYIVI